MVRDEAPAATISGVNGIGTTGREIGSGPEVLRLFPENGPASFVAAEIHLGRRPAAINDDRPHCNIQVACHTGIYEICL
jgi:hypothetical protein